MKTLKRWIKNLKWLFNHPPTTYRIVSADDGGVCEFCGTPNNWIRYPANNGGICICYDCMAKAFRKVLAPKKPKSK